MNPNLRMRYAQVGALAASLLFSYTLSASPALIAPPSGTIGVNLEAFTTVRLTEPAPEEGLILTITSDHPEALVLSADADQAGAKSLELKIRPHQIESDPFYIQALSGHGSVSYTVSAKGCAPVKGEVTIAKSAVLIGGPSNSPAFHTTTGTPHRITARTAILDDNGKEIGTLPVAGGRTIKVEIASSDPKVGAVNPASVTLASGAVSGVVEFKPAGPGTTVLTPSVPEGFYAAPGRGVTVTVNLPGIGLMTDINIGKDLQVLGYVLLGDDAPAGGLDVTLTSQDPTRLILSTDANKVGSKSITVHIPAGKGTAPYFLQSLGDSGEVHYTGVAQNYRTRDAVIDLTPSGFMVVFTPYGPPDEEEVLRPMPRPNARPFFASLSDPKPLFVSVWSVYLDPKTHRGADITAQQLRAGVSVPLTLNNTNPSVAEVRSSFVLSTKTAPVMTKFSPHKAGETTISVNTPPGFVTPSNATSVTAIVEP